MRGVSNRAKWCPRFQDLKISLGSQDFYGISIYGFRDFYGISMGFMGFLWDYFRILRYFTEIIGINILLGISDLGFKQDFSSDFSICVQDFSLLRTPRLHEHPIEPLYCSLLNSVFHFHFLMHANSTIQKQYAQLDAQYN